jgi:hypothetical protein
VSAVVELAAANPAGDVLTYTFMVTLFIAVLLWGFFSRKRR